MSDRKLSREIRRLIYWTVSGLGGILLGVSLVLVSKTFDIERLAYLSLPILPVFFGFSSLLYNRARALPSGAEQRRSLYAAERAMQATVIYLLGLAAATVLIAILWAIGMRPGAVILKHPEVWLVIPIILMLYAYLCFCFALHAVIYRLLLLKLEKPALRRLR